LNLIVSPSKMALNLSGVGAAAASVTSSVIGPTMEMGRWPLSRSESSFVQIPFRSHAPFACGLLAARKWLPAEKRTRLTEVLKWRVMVDLKSS
jgi:hypothetical protein